MIEISKLGFFILRFNAVHHETIGLFLYIDIKLCFIRLWSLNTDSFFHLTFFFVFKIKYLSCSYFITLYPLSVKYFKSLQSVQQPSWLLSKVRLCFFKKKKKGFTSCFQAVQLFTLKERIICKEKCFFWKDRIKKKFESTCQCIE